MDKLFYTTLFVLSIIPIISSFIEKPMENTFYPAIRPVTLLVAIMCLAIGMGFLIGRAIS